MSEVKKMTTYSVEKEIFREHGLIKTLVHNGTFVFCGISMGIGHKYGYFFKLNELIPFLLLWAGVSTIIDFSLGIFLHKKYPQWRRCIHFLIWYSIGCFFVVIASLFLD
jgi:hypothetical protein